MPPKRKATITTTTEKPDSTTDIVKTSKKSKKTEATNGIQNEDEQVSSPPKRSRPARSTKTVVSYDETKKSPKAKREPPKTKKPKADKPSTVSKSPQAGPSWRMTPDPEDRGITKRKPKKETEPKKEKTEKSTAKKAKPDENLQNGDANEKEKSKSKRGKAKSVEVNQQNGDVEKENEPKVKEAQNKTDTVWEDLDFSCNQKNEFGVKHNLVISTWNVGGIRSWVSKGCVDYLKHEQPDILCVQEAKCTTSKLPLEVRQLKNYHQYWCPSEKDSYAGVGLLTVKEPKSVAYGIGNVDLDVEGRCLTAEFDQFYLLNVYVPNAGRKLITMPKRLEWNKAFKQYVKELQEKKPVIICGDMNVSHNPIDLARPKSNTKNAGFTVEEREGMTELLNEGIVDVYRHLYPDQTDVYSFWTYMSNARAKNVGWRLDYFLVSKELIKGVSDMVYRTQVFGSDHCPATLFINV